ncbi:hypothetical protein HS088_TW09G01282 [Tripterygium wilfordii]|uniref:Uncharacterized protein n=1 Tax=Tripterygium wilfordii TaxID=458696 RepID=A0A7J7DA31_TRIWF|nr:hypothetical protein HS088_TW09G01282 [Tripterygium wilfordii]
MARLSSMGTCQYSVYRCADKVLHIIFFAVLYFILLCLLVSRIDYHSIDSKILTVGEELWKETLPLQSGSRLYQLKGIKPSSWYEVKISYPASIPARFSVELKKDSAELGLNRNRRLLNTEKLIFKTDGVTALNNKDKVFVLVTVEPEGFVAIPHVPERKFITYNIGWYMYAITLSINTTIYGGFLWSLSLWSYPHSGKTPRSYRSYC